MVLARVRRNPAVVIFFAAMMAAACPAQAAGQATAGERRTERQAAAGEKAQTPGAALTVVADERDARETREKLRELLSKYPPALGRVLKLDPSLLSNEAYLTSYPGLRAYLARHPEVAHNPGYFLEFVGGPRDVWTVPDPRNQAIHMWESFFEGLGIFLIFVTVTATLAWLIRTLIDYRRWLRLSKVQAEVHNKLLDRFASNNELLAYIETPAGRRFLESAPIPLDPGTRSLSAPVGRILWSVQAGLVLAVGGLGLQFVSNRVQEEVAPAMFAMGVLALSLGAGFVLSAIVSFMLSKRLGLLEPPALSQASERSGPASS